MRVFKILAWCEDLQLGSANDKLIYSIKNHQAPELELEDGSVLLFDSSEDYYKLMINRDLVPAEIGHMMEVNTEYLDTCIVDKDDVTNGVYRNRDITEVIEYKVEDKRIIRLIF